MIKNMFWKGFIVGGAIFIITATIIYQRFIATPEISLTQLELQDIKGNTVKMDNYNGKPLVINYWATWCAPCLKEFPHFEEVKSRFENDINFVMISDESMEKIISFSKKRPYNLNFLRSYKKFSEYGINEMTSIPTTYFYDSEGNLITKHTSGLTKETLLELIGRIY